MIATKRYGADESTAAELTKVKGKGTVKRTQHIADANYIIVDVDLVIHSVAIDALRMMQLVRDRVDDPDEFVKRIKRSGIDSEMVLGGSGWPCTIL
jgi:hypothetical protein